MSLIVPKTGTKKFEAKISIVKIPLELKERLEALKCQGNSEADIVREALDKFLPKKKAKKEESDK